MSYKLVVMDSEGRLAQSPTASANGDRVMVTIDGLNTDTLFWYYVKATNQFGASNETDLTRFSEYCKVPFFFFEAYNFEDLELIRFQLHLMFRMQPFASQERLPTPSNAAI